MVQKKSKGYALLLVSKMPRDFFAYIPRDKLYYLPFCRKHHQLLGHKILFQDFDIASTVTRPELLAQYNCPVTQSREILLTGGSSADTGDRVTL